MARPNIAALTNGTAAPINVLNKVLDALSIGVFPKKAIRFAGDVNTLTPAIDAVYLLGAGVTNGTAGEILVFKTTAIASQVAYIVENGVIVDGYVKVAGDWVLFVPTAWSDGSVFANTSLTITIPVFSGRVLVTNSVASAITTTLTIVGSTGFSPGATLVYSDGTTLFI